MCGWGSDHEVEGCDGDALQGELQRVPILLARLAGVQVHVVPPSVVATRAQPPGVALRAAAEGAAEAALGGRACQDLQARFVLWVPPEPGVGPHAVARGAHSIDWARLAVASCAVPATPHQPMRSQRANQYWSNRSQRLERRRGRGGGGCFTTPPVYTP